MVAGMSQGKKQSGFDELNREINSRWKIYIDTCSLYRTTSDGNVFWDKFVPILESNNVKFTVTAETFREFKRHKYNKKHRANDDAMRLELILAQFARDRKDLMLITDGDGTFNDRAIVSIVNQRASKFNQVYITNDLNNAWDVYRVFHHSHSIPNHTKLLIFKVVGNGEIVHPKELWLLPELNEREQAEYFRMRKERKYEEAERFLSDHSGYRMAGRKPPKRTRGDAHQEHHALSRRGEDADENGRLVSRNNGVEAPNAKGIDTNPAIEAVINPDYEMPKTGDTLRGVQRQTIINVTLGKRIAKGGEGFIYEIEPGSQAGDGCLAKIYKKSKLCKTAGNAIQTLAKINHIVGNRYDSKNVPGNKKMSIGRYAKFPIYLLVNDDDEFVGYVMKKGSGIQLSTFIAAGAVEAEFNKAFPDVTKTHLVEICINFLRVMRALHERGIIVGDLNSNNILIDTKTCFVTLIDADSYQYGNRFSCNVGVEKYTSPEFLQNHESNFRTEQNELFVEARILCEILLMVDNPYNSKNASGDPVRDMVNGEFRYTFDFMDGHRQTNRQAPGEEMEVRWGQLTKELKDAFGNTFHHNGKYWVPGNRLDEDFWISALENYKKEIKESLSEGNGFVSNDVFPKERRAWVLHFRCEKCGKSGLQDANAFLPAVVLAPIYEDASDVARRYCISCYCEQIGIEEGRCSICGKPTLVKKGYKKNFCQSCFRKGQSKGVCSVCGEEMIIQVWDQARSSHICKKCSAHVSCSVCGRQFPKYKLDDRGRCKNCRTVLIECTKCGKTVETKPGAYRSGYICQECRRPVHCPECGFDNHGHLAKWMLDENGGVCRRCASKKKRDTTEQNASRNSAPLTSSANQSIQVDALGLSAQTGVVPGPEQKKSWIEKTVRLFEGIFGL